MVKIITFVIYSFLLVLGSSLALLLPKGSRTLSPRQQAQLHEKYILGWQINTETQEIIFDVKVETHGFVGFGINSIGSMIGADIVIGGVDSEGNHYFSDRHGNGTNEPIIDVEQNWILLEASEGEDHTFLKFSRKWDTCDTNDFKINDDTVRIIWSFGETDNIEYHGINNKGAREFNLLDGPPPPVDISKFEKWEIRVNDTMPSVDTSYYCTMHKSPTFPGKRHLVGFNTFLENDAAVKHTHHFIAAKCTAPIGENPDEFFGQYLGQPGGECENDGPYQHLKNYCTSYIYVWGVGGQMTLFPEHVGYTIGEERPYEYLLFEVHYDNPASESNVQFTTGFDVFITDDIRPEEAELLIMGHDVFHTQLLPPDTQEFTIAGHCSSECTREGIPENGVKIFNYMFHSHLAGRRMRVHHYRDGTELPWIANDDRYDFNFQQARNLRDEIVLKPGDQMALECIYNTEGREKATFAGLSTREEMCQVLTWYYPKSSLSVCISAYFSSEDLYNGLLKLGIEEMNATENNHNPIITKPESMAGLPLQEIIDSRVEWTPQLIKDMQKLLQFDPHGSICDSKSKAKINNGIINLKNVRQLPLVTYPEVDEIYVPDDICQEKTNQPDMTTQNQSETTENYSESTENHSKTTEKNGGGKTIGLGKIKLLLLLFVPYLSSSI